MKKNRFRPSAFQIFGVLLIAAGAAVLVRTGINAVKYSAAEDGDPAVYDEASEDGTSAADSGEEEQQAVMTARGSGFSAAPCLWLGAGLILCGVPFFYIPHGEEFRFRRRKRRKDDEVHEDKEFDYPDDEFDFVLDEETREKLLEEKFRKIYEKEHRGGGS